MEEWEGGGIRYDDKDAAQTAGRKIREQYNGRRRAEEGRARLTVKSEFFYADDRLVDSTDPRWLH